MNARQNKIRLKNDKWWQGATIYQIYPRSFKDTNGDGIGDLRGCLEGLDYIASLGVDAIWLSPFFTSPMEDFGYDVADYVDVDPMFGSLADFKNLIKEAHKRDIKIIIDQVYSHTSDQHAWFKESRKDKKNPKADWYVWADPKPDGAPPNNWQSVFGGVAWEWDNTRRQYYLHNFLTSQPDLNLHHQDVQTALQDVAKFWLDLGVDGFRLDAINFGMHDQQLRDNPPATNLKQAPTRPFDFQQHKYSMSHKDMPLFLEQLRALLDQYENRFTVAEVVGPDPLDEMKSFVAPGRLHSAYSFEYLYAKKIDANLIEKNILDWQKGDAWPAWAFSNHDAPRCISRWSNGRDINMFARTMMLLLMAQRGNVFIYQGEELGLVQADIPFEKLQDPEAIKNWPETLGRDGARTPLPWQKEAPNLGFTTGEPWLPIDPRHQDHAIDLQNNADESMLNFTRDIIAYRQNSQALRLGDITLLSKDKTQEDMVIFTRQYENEVVLCIVNLGMQACSLDQFTGQEWSLAFSSTQGKAAAPMSLPDILPAGAGILAYRNTPS